MNNALDDLLHRLGAIVPLAELERACGVRVTHELIETGQAVTTGSSGAFVTAMPSLQDPRRR